MAKTESKKLRDKIEKVKAASPDQARLDELLNIMFGRLGEVLAEACEQELYFADIVNTKSDTTMSVAEYKFLKEEVFPKIAFVLLDDEELED